MIIPLFQTFKKIFLIANNRHLNQAFSKEIFKTRHFIVVDTSSVHLITKSLSIVAMNSRVFFAHCASLVQWYIMFPVKIYLPSSDSIQNDDKGIWLRKQRFFIHRKARDFQSKHECHEKRVAS